MANVMKSYKERKEEFVSNHYGGTISEINLVTAVAPAAYLFFCVLQSRLQFFTSYGPLQFLCDFILNVLSVLFSFTIYSSYPVLLNALILAPAIIIYSTQKPHIQRAVVPPVDVKKPRDGTQEVSGRADLQMPKKAFLTIYRGGMMVFTCIAILAVDFPVFPRRFAKVENWGTSLMDLGVGSFVFSSGVVSARGVLRELHAFEQSQAHKSEFTRVSAGRRLSTAFRSSLPLLILGFIRLASVKGTDYAEHVTEYGYHWNFFFTLALLPPFVNFFQFLLFLLPSRLLTVEYFPTIYAILSIAVASVYQLVLETTGLKGFILVGDREPWGLIGWNKEGIFSFFGYLAIFLAGMSSGGYLLPSQQGSSVKKSRIGPLGNKLMMWSAIWTVLFLAVYEYKGLGLAVSRRMANLPYILWTAAYNTCQITACYLIESYFSGGTKIPATHHQHEGRYKSATPPVLEAFNRDGLLIFLLANILTGCVNLSLNTLDMPNHFAVGVLALYAFVLVAAAKGLEFLEWRRFLSW